MRIVLVGGPAGDGLEVLIPRTSWPSGAGGEGMPPYVCTGLTEPFQHYLHLAGTSRYAWVGACRSIEHSGSYPHEHGRPSS